MCVTCIRTKTRKAVTLVRDRNINFVGIDHVKHLDDRNENNLKLCENCTRVIDFDYLKRFQGSKVQINALMLVRELNTHFDLSKSPYTVKFERLDKMVDSLWRDYNLTLSPDIYELYRNTFNELLSEFSA